MGRFGVGQACRRVEDARFLTGAGRFTDDVSMPDAAFAVVVRSPHAHARILGIDTEEAASAPGVLAVMTAADAEIAALGPIPCAFLQRNRDGSTMPAPERLVLARDTVRHVGEAVAFVVADTLAQARDAAELVAVAYDPLAAVVDVADAIAPGAPVLHAEAPGNVVFDWELGDAAAVAAAFARAARVVALALVNNRLAPMALEARGAIGAWDEAGGRYTLISGTQGVHAVRDWLADILRVPPRSVRVVTPDVGGGFGMRLFVYPEHALVLVAARRLGRPVRWLADRSESFAADSHGRDHRAKAELALDDQGRFLALRVETLANLGAALSQFAAFIPTRAFATMLTGAYDIPALYARVRGVATNTAPVDAYRGAGRPEATYLIERLVDKAARETGIAPDALRRINFIPAAAMPYRTAGGKTYDSGEFAANLDDALKRADWAGFPARRAEAAGRGRLRGIGLACYVEAAAGGDDETAEIRIGADGTATVLIGTQSTGQGHETAYAQMAAAALALPIERVRVIQGDTDLVRVGNGTGGSRSLPVGGAALVEALDDLIAAGRQVAARALGVAAEEIHFADGAFHTGRGNGHLELVEAAAAGALVGRATYQPKAGTFPNGCHVAEVEIDPETGALALVAHTIVDDVGVVMNPMLLRGQIVGGAVQGIGQALFEQAVYDRDSGQLVTGSLVDYAIARAADIPPIAHATHEVPCRRNPLGVKGAGEAGTIGAPPAVINAIVHALAPFGVDHIDMPATPERVWRAMQQQRKPG